MPSDRALLEAVLDMHRPADLHGEQVCQHCTVFAEDFGAITVAYPCPTRTVIEGGRDG